MKKIRVGILFGGKSAEHEVSVQSAKNVYEALDKEKYEPILIGIDKKGRWHVSDAAKLRAPEEGKMLAAVKEGGQLMAIEPGEGTANIDVVFPVLHGPFGEDGTVQGLLKLADVPFVGPSVLGSAVGMDKDVMKRLFQEAGIPTSRFIAIRDYEKDVVDLGRIIAELGLPVFVKPANLGSSVGISKAKTKDEFKKAVDEAFRYDRKILVEEFIKGREIECAVLGNDDPKASIPGEIIPQHEFYSYEAKYLDENGALLKIPADLSPDIAKKAQELSVKVFKILCCEGMGRVDSFLRDDGEIFVNEINTIPGFTKISMYPKLWEASGISYPKLINRLIELAIERFEKEKKLKTSVN